MANLLTRLCNRLGMNQSLILGPAHNSDDTMPIRSNRASMAPTEENVARCNVFLERLLIALRRAVPSTSTPSPWIKLIQEVELAKGNLYIAVIGATGEGKSSLINALLHEVKLIPTSCMRACTSVVTEISYNHLPGLSHRAQVDFIALEEWREESMTLLNDLHDDRKSLTDKNSPAAIALSKIQAVYPSVDVSQLEPTDVDTLMSMTEVANVLGIEKSFEAESGEELHDRITDYIDSKEEGIERSDKMQLWPLIRKVAVQTRADVLRDGTVIVDLPGLLDSNPARAAIAQNYLQRCDAVWFVANINRARDNATAKSFFEKELKRQLHLDGTIRRVTFICSKTDDIKISEVRDAFSKSTTPNSALARIDAEATANELKLNTISKNLKAAQQSFEQAVTTDEVLEVNLRELRRLQKRSEAGEAVWPLRRIEPNRGKRGGEPSEDEPEPKKSATGGHRTKVKEEFPQTRRSAARRKRDIRFEEDKLQPPLSLTGTRELIDDLEQERDDLRSEKAEYEDKVYDLQSEQDKASAQQAALRDEEWQTCVAMRNKQVSELIRQKFAEDINDFYTKRYQDEDDFDPSQHVAAEGDQASSLPVYCVSARGYEEVSGWQNDAKWSSCFSNIQQTQIPLLIEHARQLGKERQQQHAAAYLHEVRSLLLSIRIWSNGRKKAHTAEAYALFSEASQLAMVDKFWTDILEITRRTFTQVKSVTENQVLRILSSAGKHGASRAAAVAKTWRENAWNTYQAACRHHGYFVSSSGNGRTVDFNGDLTTPFLDYIAIQWARLFNQTLIAIFNGSTIQGNTAVMKFKEEFVEMMKTYGSTPDDIGIFHEQLSLFLGTIDNVLNSASGRIQEHQRETNRRPVLQIKSDMLDTYQACAMEHGSGMYKRMKDHMESSIDRKKDHMFSQVTRTVNMNIDAGLQNVTEDSLYKLANSWSTFRNDCAQLLSTKPTDFTMLSGEIQFEIRQILDEADLLFGCQSTQPVRLLADRAEDPDESWMFFPESR